MLADTAALWVRLLQFPVYIPLGPFPLHAHLVFEALAYLVGFQLYFKLRRAKGDVIPEQARWTVIAAAIAGAALGSKLLFLLEDPAETLRRWNDLAYLTGGKTIVGGLIGGLLAVEWIKWKTNLTTRTGDLFALPLVVSILLGRFGCFFAGLPDRTYGLATSLPWGVDFGDGIARHPTQLYEILFLVALGALLRRNARRPHANGDLFQQFMLGYFSFRLAVDFLKPGVVFAGLTALQWASAAMVAYYLPDLHRWVTRQVLPAAELEVKETS